MNTNMLVTAAKLSDEALLARLEALAGRAREATAELIAHIAELDVRKAHRGEGPGSLFAYCTQVLRLSQAATYNRIEAAKAARRFPVILELLADGAINLTTVRVLAPHLTAENHHAALQEAIRRTKEEVKEIAARLSPQPDVPPSVRMLPAPSPRAVTPPVAAAAAPPSASGPQLGGPMSLSPANRPLVEPLAPERYRVQFTVGRETRLKLRRVQELLRREIPDGDPGAIFDRALTLLLAEVEKKKFAATARPRPLQPAKVGSRHIPAHVKRAVWKRDGERCAFVGPKGRCSERTFLEFHHRQPHGYSGEATVENIALRCRAHNVYEAELVYGLLDPAVVRETPPPYGNTIGRELVPEPIWGRLTARGARLSR
jgi:hypothetical protein